VISLLIPGRPRGKQRPRFNRATGRAYTPQETVSFEQRVQGEWIAAGRPRMADGPLVATVRGVYQRPGSHLRVKGGLTAAGMRAPFPMPSVDLDNLAKAVLDSLNGLAYKDDRQIVHLTVCRRWAVDGESDHTYVHVREAKT